LWNDSSYKSRIRLSVFDEHFFIAGRKGLRKKEEDLIENRRETG
jgi:hypothetical protein